MTATNKFDPAPPDPDWKPGGIIERSARLLATRIGRPFEEVKAMLWRGYQDRQR